MARCRFNVRRRAPFSRSAGAAPMPTVLLADHDFPDLDLERTMFADAGVEFAAAQCKTEDDVIAHGRGCRAILLQYAPITARVLDALPNVGIVSRIGAG